MFLMRRSCLHRVCNLNFLKRFVMNCLGKLNKITCLSQTDTVLRLCSTFKVRPEADHRIFNWFILFQIYEKNDNFYYLTKSIT